MGLIELVLKLRANAGCKLRHFTQYFVLFVFLFPVSLEAGTLFTKSIQIPAPVISLWLDKDHITLEAIAPTNHAPMTVGAIASLHSRFRIAITNNLHFRKQEYPDWTDRTRSSQTVIDATVYPYTWADFSRLEKLQLRLGIAGRTVVQNVLIYEPFLSDHGKLIYNDARIEVIADFMDIASLGLWFGAGKLNDLESDISSRDAGVYTFGTVAQVGYRYIFLNVGAGKAKTIIDEPVLKLV